MAAKFLEIVNYQMGLLSLFLLATLNTFSRGAIKAHAMEINDEFTHYKKIAVIMYELLSSVLKITLAHQHRIHDV